MSSAIVSVVIKSDRYRKRPPKIGEMVRVAGRVGLYEVVRVDRERRVVDVRRKSSPFDSGADVPFKSIQFVDKRVSKTIEEFLGS